MKRVSVTLESEGAATGLFAAGLAAVDRMVEELRGSDYALRCGTAAVDELLIYREDIARMILNTLAQEGVLKVEEESN